MAIVWNNRNDLSDPNSRNGRESFQEHNERMRIFCDSHADVTMVNAPRCDELALLQRTRLLHVVDIRREIGGVRRHANVEDWSTFVPVWKVAQYKLW